MQKTNFKTRLLALLTAVFMVVMCVPFAAFADAETIHVAFSDEKGLVKEYDITATSKECAPELPDNYYWKSNFSSYGVGDLNSNDPSNFDNLTKAPWPHVGFTKTEKPAPATKFDYYIQNTDKNGYVAVLGDAQVQNLTYDNGTETLPLPYEKITANDGYKFDGWKISVQPVEGSVKEFTVPAGTQSFSIKEYGELNLVGASAIFSEVETPVTKFDYYIQNTDKNGYVAVLGDAQVQNLTYDNGTETLPLPYERITAKDGYKFDGWKISVQPVEGSVKEFTVPAGTQSFSIKEYGELTLVGASAIFSEVETPVTKFDYYIQNTDKNGYVAVLGDAQVQNLTYDNGTETLPLPYEKITAKDGYKFDGWKISVQPVEGSVKEFTVPAGTQSFSIKEYGELTLVGASAIFSKVETPVTYFDYTIQNASKNGKVQVLGDEQIQTVSLPSTTTVLDLPYEKITANDGYVFAGWTIYVQPKTGDADKFVVAAGTKSVDVSKYGELTLAGASAIFNKVDNFTFTIQNASKNGKVEVLGNEQIQSVELPVTTKELPLPYEKITANDGYVFAGWTIYVQPKNGNADKFVVKAGAKSVDVSKYGELSLAGASAIFEEKTAETFTYAIQNASKNGKVEVLGDEQLQSVELPVGTKELPLPYEKITANDGYVFAGWTIYVQPKNGNADKFVVKAGTKSVDVSKYGDLALAGASAIFEKKTDDKKDNSTSSSSSSNNSTSSSSSSSNKTTTASSQAEQKVVKAAAARLTPPRFCPRPVLLMLLRCSAAAWQLLPC